MKIMHVVMGICAVSALQTAQAAQTQSGVVLPHEHHRNGIAWMSGGIGKAEADAMRAQASRYDLRLVLAEARKPRAAFLGQATVKITDARGKATSIRTDGPLLFLKLPPGHYSVMADVEGHRLTRSVTVTPKAPVQATLLWPKSVG